MSLKEIKTETEHYFEDEFGNKQDEYKWWHDNGKLLEHCYYVDDKRHGEFKEWWTNGQLWRHCYYVDGKLHGEYKWWYDNGQQLEHCYYVDDKRHGEYNSWYSDGKLWRHYFYVDGNKVIDFRVEPEEYPTSDEVKTYFALKYGCAKWLP
jgi:antitoxin component YwqK of YwqJK toxin-antitoxin module